jgi:hypothetical protein
MASAEISWSIASPKANVASHAFIAWSDGKPRSTILPPVGSCTRPYTPSATATAPPARAAATSAGVEREEGAGSPATLSMLWFAAMSD